MNTTSISVATITLARDDGEARLIVDGLSSLAATGMPIAVSDGGSPPAVVAAITAIPGVALVPPGERGLIPQVQASLQAAADRARPFILYTESDKQRFFEQSLAAFLSLTPEADDVGIVLAGRTEGAFATFPPLQRFCETTISVLTAEATGVVADYSYGPFLMRRDLAERLATVPPRLGWGWRHYIFATAAQLGFRIVPIAGDHPCPEHQRQEDADERLHRLRQLSQNVDGLVLAASALGRATRPT
jgi:hypothetical protein